MAVAVVERFKRGMYGLSAATEKSGCCEEVGRCREVAVSGHLTVIDWMSYYSCRLYCGFRGVRMISPVIGYNTTNIPDII